MATFVTGDIHGNPGRLISAYDKRLLNEGDKVIILGDAGFNFFGNGRNYRTYRDIHCKNMVKDLPFQILCVRGNHERRPSCYFGYEEKEMFGNKVYVQEEYPNLIFLEDGCDYLIDGKRCLVLGGAYSVDKKFRIEGKTWFANEQLSQRERRIIWKKVIAQRRYDIVLSHTCPFKYIPKESFKSKLDDIDTTTEEWLDLIEDIIDYDAWYCGHYHINKDIDNLTFLFQDIRDINYLNKAQFEATHCRNCGSQACSGVDSQCFNGCELKELLL